jgi:hypothetical protein
MSTQPKIVRAHCNKCGQETKHDVVMERIHRDSEVVDPYQGIEVSWSKTYSMLECRGCEEVSLCCTEWCSENDPMDGPEPGTYFPPRVSRRKPAWVDRLAVPSEYAELLDEIYVALHADSRRLAMMGARALIDMAITRSVGDQGNFGGGLTCLVEKQLISERNRGIIEAAVDVGHASAHRGHRPSSDDVNVVIDIVENLIHNELLAEPAQALKSTTPQRERARAGKKKD